MPNQFIPPIEGAAGPNFTHNKVSNGSNITTTHMSASLVSDKNYDIYISSEDIFNNDLSDLYSNASFLSNVTHLYIGQGENSGHIGGSIVPHSHPDRKAFFTVESGSFVHGTSSTNASYMKFNGSLIYDNNIISLGEGPGGVSGDVMLNYVLGGSSGGGGGGGGDSGSRSSAIRQSMPGSTFTFPGEGAWHPIDLSVANYSNGELFSASNSASFTYIELSSDAEVFFNYGLCIQTNGTDRKHVYAILQKQSNGSDVWDNIDYSVMVIGTHAYGGAGVWHRGSMGTIMLSLINGDKIRLAVNTEHTGIHLISNASGTTYLSAFNMTIASTSLSGSGITGVQAGNGLSGGGNSGTVVLNVSVDNSTLEISNDIIKVKDNASFINGSFTNLSVSGSLTVDGESITSSGGGTPSGSDTYIQYNASGVFGASSDLTFNDTTKLLIVNGSLTVSGNLHVNGSTTTVYTENTKIRDQIIELNACNTSASYSGIVINNVSNSDESNIFMGWVGDIDSFVVGKTHDNASSPTLTVNYTDITGANASFINGSFVNISGTSNASFSSGSFTNISGSGSASFTSGSFTNISGDSASFSNGSFTNISGDNASFSNGSFVNISGDNASFSNGSFVNISGDSGSFTSGSFTNISGDSGSFTSGSFTNISGDNASFSNGSFTNISGDSASYISGSFTNLNVSGSLTVGGVDVAAGGSDTQIQYNNGGVFAGSSSLVFYSGSSTLAVNGSITATGDITAFYASSDKRLKKNIVTIENPLDIINNIRGVRFNWNEEAQKVNSGVDLNKIEMGVIAQEIEDHIPEVIKDGLQGYKAVRYEKIVPLLIETIKEQQKQINKLNDRLEKLENMFN